MNITTYVRSRGGVLNKNSTNFVYPTPSWRPRYFFDTGYTMVKRENRDGSVRVRYLGPVGFDESVYYFMRTQLYRYQYAAGLIPRKVFYMPLSKIAKWVLMSKIGNK